MNLYPLKDTCPWGVNRNKITNVRTSFLANSHVIRIGVFGMDYSMAKRAFYLTRFQFGMNPTRYDAKNCFVKLFIRRCITIGYSEIQSQNLKNLV